MGFPRAFQGARGLRRRLRSNVAIAAGGIFGSPVWIGAQGKIGQDNFHHHPAILLHVRKTRGAWPARFGLHVHEIGPREHGANARLEGCAEGADKRNKKLCLAVAVVVSAPQNHVAGRKFFAAPGVFDVTDPVAAKPLQIEDHAFEIGGGAGGGKLYGFFAHSRRERLEARLGVKPRGLAGRRRKMRRAPVRRARPRRPPRRTLREADRCFPH